MKKFLVTVDDGTTQHRVVVYGRHAEDAFEEALRVVGLANRTSVSGTALELEAS